MENNTNIDFTFQQKIAMMRILLDIIHADGIIDARENFFFNQLKEKFGMDDSDYEVVKDKNSLLALVQIKEMDNDQKKQFAYLMNKMIIVDDDIDVNEVAIYNVVNEFCKMETDFKGFELE